jgi:hypothetical protein
LLSIDGGTGATAYANVASTTASFSTAITTFGTAGATGTNYVANISLGIINGANAGTVTLQAAANGAGTLTIQPGSFCVMQ